MMLRQLSRRNLAGASLHAAPRRGLASTMLLSTEKEWLSRSANELRREAKARGLSQGGTKTDIARRLVESLKSEQSAPLSTMSSSSSASSSPASTVSSTSTPQMRAFASSARYNRGDEVENDKFTPKRKYTLNVKIPEEREEVLPGPTIPYLPDYYMSHETQSASPTQKPLDPDRPRVLTVASASTHVDGGPSHGMHDTADAHALEDAASKAQAKAAELVDKAKQSVDTSALGVSSLVAEYVAWPKVEWEEKGSGSGKEEASTDKLSSEDRRGLYTLVGIFGGGWLLSKTVS